MQDLQHIAGPQRVPRVKDVIMTKANADPRRQQPLHPGNAPLGSRQTALQMNIHQRIGDKVDAGELKQAEQTRGKRHYRVHSGGMAGRYPRLPFPLSCQRGNGFNSATAHRHFHRSEYPVGGHIAAPDGRRCSIPHHTHGELKCGIAPTTSASAEAQ